MFHGNTSFAKEHRQWSVFLFSCLLSFLLRGKYVDKYLAWELGHSTPWYPKPPSQKLETCSNIDSIGARDFTAFARKEGRKEAEQKSTIKQQQQFLFCKKQHQGSIQLEGRRSPVHIPADDA